MKKIFVLCQEEEEGEKKSSGSHHSDGILAESPFTWHLLELFVAAATKDTFREVQAGTVF